MRKKLDRRRLEETFLIYASREILRKYKICTDAIQYDKDDMLNIVCEEYYKVFTLKWGGKFRTDIHNVYKNYKELKV